METIKFKREYLASYSIVVEPGKYALQVSNDVTDKNLVANEDGTSPRYIVGLKAIASDKVAQLKEVFKDTDEVEIDQTNGLFMTANIWANGNERLPVKGEMIDCVVDMVKSRESEELVLRIVGSKVRKAIVAPKLDLVKLFEQEVDANPPATTLVHN